MTWKNFNIYLLKKKHKMRHFKNKKEAVKFKDSQSANKGLKIFKKIKGQKNRIQKPFLVGTEFEFLNQD